MSATYNEAKDAIIAVFKTAWDTTNLVAIYENVKGATPTTEDAWARVVMRHGTPFSAGSLSGALGVQRFDRVGLFIVSIFIPNGEGLKQGYILGKTLADAFEGQDTPNAVWFRRASLNEIGPDGEWYQLNFIVEFEYEEIK